MTTTIYSWDSNKIYSGSQVIEPGQSVPPRSTLATPPGTTGTEVARWTGTGWEVLPERPVPPTPEPEPAPVPSSCTRRQGRLALLQNDLLDDVEDAIAAIPDPAQRRAAQIEYEADTWDRGNAFLQGMWAQMGGTEEGLDDLFRLAVTL